jgi:hypothetical protein
VTTPWIFARRNTSTSRSRSRRIDTGFRVSVSVSASSSCFSPSSRSPSTTPLDFLPFSPFPFPLDCPVDLGRSICYTHGRPPDDFAFLLLNALIPVSVSFFLRGDCSLSTVSRKPVRILLSAAPLRRHFPGVAQNPLTPYPVAFPHIVKASSTRIQKIAAACFLSSFSSARLVDAAVGRRLNFLSRWMRHQNSWTVYR